MPTNPAERCRYLAGRAWLRGENDRAMKWEVLAAMKEKGNRYSSAPCYARSRIKKPLD